MFTPSIPLPPPGLPLARRRPAALRRPDAPRTVRRLLSAPFDLMRWQYAGAVGAGWVRRSLLSSARMERSIDALETLTLGPWARRR